MGTRQPLVDPPWHAAITPKPQLDELVPAALLATRVSIGDATNPSPQNPVMPAQLRRTHNRPHLALPASVAGEFAFTNKFIAYGFLAEDREQTAFDLSALKKRHSQTARQKG
jgi:hypothetical protein